MADEDLRRSFLRFINCEWFSSNAVLRCHYIRKLFFLSSPINFENGFNWLWLQLLAHPSGNDFHFSFRSFAGRSIVRFDLHAFDAATEVFASRRFLQNIGLLCQRMAAFRCYIILMYFLRESPTRDRMRWTSFSKCTANVSDDAYDTTPHAQHAVMNL